MLSGGYRLWTGGENFGHVEPADEAMDQPWANQIASGWVVTFFEGPEEGRLSLEVTVYAVCAMAE